MQQYFLKTAGLVTLLGLSAAGSFAQDKKSSAANRNEDVIIVKTKTDVDTKFTIEINGADVKINGKPLADYKNDDVIISKRKQSDARELEEIAEVDAIRAPRTRFRGGSTVYSYKSADNALKLSGGMSNSNKAFLGVGTEKPEHGDGVSVTSVSDESPAEKAGLKEGDIITKINDVKVNSHEELTKTIGTFKPEEKITITYKRDDKEQKASAVLAKNKMGDAFTLNTTPFQSFKNYNYNGNDNFNFAWSGKARLGLKAQETEDGKGLKVLDVDDESTAEKAGIKEGDIITSFDGTAVNNIEKLRELSKPALDKTNFKVKIIRDGKEQEIEVKIPKNLKTTDL